ncbi:MAG: hypothetical protein IKX80_07085 [Lachnospiraceae bacterium]|nr:hypothetical protein [Lachnospiraceae bacterium]
MIKVFKTDLFRLLRTKAFYVYPIFLVLIQVLNMSLSVAFVSTDGTETVTEIASGRAIELGPVELAKNIGDGLLMLFLGLALVIFITNESRHGFLKNAAGCATDKRFLPISKILTGIVIMFVYIVESIIITAIFSGIEALISGKALEYKPVPEGDLGKFTAYVLLCILVHIAVIAILVLMHEITHNRALGLVAIFMYSATLIDKLIVGFLNLVSTKITWLADIHFRKYLMMFNIEGGYLSEEYYPMTLLVLCLIYGTAATFLAIQASVRRDVK